MKWRLVEIPDSEAVADDLSDSELIGVSILLTEYSGEPRDVQTNVYWRARAKIQPQVWVALNRQNED